MNPSKKSTKKANTKKQIKITFKTDDVVKIKVCNLSLQQMDFVIKSLQKAQQQIIQKLHKEEMDDMPDQLRTLFGMLNKATK